MQTLREYQLENSIKCAKLSIEYSGYGSRQYESPNFFGCHEFVWNYQNGSLKFVKLIKLIENWLGARIQKFFCTCVEIFCSCCW